MNDREQKKIISENLKDYIYKSGKSQKDIAIDLDVKTSTFSQWVTGKATPSVTMLQRVAAYFGVRIEDIVDKSMPEDKQVIKVPVLGGVAAGIPIEMVRDIVDMEELNADDFPKGEYFGLIIRGDSMEPRIHDGDTIIVKQQPDVESGDFAVVAINGDNATCKRIMKYEAGIMLVALNPKYEPMQFTNEEIARKPITILGKVVECRSKF